VLRLVGMAAPTIPRRPTFSDPYSKKLYATAKRDLARTQERVKKERGEEAKRRLTGIGYRPERYKVMTSCFVAGMLPRLKAVMASYGMQLPVVATPCTTGPGGGRTDFETIWVEYDTRLVASKDNLLDLNLLRRLAGVTRGIFYHELGHCRFSVPLWDLDISGYTTPGGIDSNKLRGAWNILEDQRMESAVVEESPHIATYFTGMVLELIATDERLASNYPLLCGRWYLPTELVEESRRRFVKKNDPYTGGELLACQVSECIERYMVATTAKELADEVVCLEALLRNTIPLDIDTSSRHSDPDSYYDPLGRTFEGWNEVPTERLRRTAGEVKRALNKSATDLQDHRGGEAGEDGGTWSGLGAAMQDLHQDWAADKSLTQDIAAINDALAAGGDLSYFPHIGVMTDESMKGRARAFATEITEVFRIATADSAPSWVNQQRTGNLDVLRYITREPGNLEVFRHYQDYGDPGADLKVSVLLDVSSSMDESSEELGAAGWAVKTAGDELKIDTEVHLFNAKAHALYRYGPLVVLTPPRYLSRY
jgi:hypothetical protein